MREKLSPGPGTQEPGEGRSKENSRVRAGLGKNTNPVRDLPGAAARLARRRRAGKKQTGRTALWAADALQDASRVTSLPVQTALRRDGACASCPPQVRGRAGLFPLIFRLFLFGFCCAKVFSFVAHAATGISSLVPSRGFVSGPRILLSAAFSRTFAPIACLPVLRCLCGFSLSCFFALSCLTSSSQTSFHLSLRPRRASTFFRKESRQRFARGRGSAPFEPPFLRPAADLPFPRAAGRLTRPFGPQTAGR